MTEARENYNEQLERFYKRHLADLQLRAYMCRLLDRSYELSKWLISIESYEKRCLVIKEKLFPAHALAYMDFLRGEKEYSVALKQAEWLVNNIDDVNSQENPSRDQIFDWFFYYLVETDKLVSIGAYDRMDDEDEDLLFVACGAETMDPELFCSDEIKQDSSELRTFLLRCVRRGRGFDPDYIANCLGLSISEVKKRHIFSNEEMGALLQLSEASVASLLAGTATPTELGAIARKVHYLTRSIRQLKELRKDPGGEFVAAAADGGVKRFQANEEILKKEFDKAVLKYRKATRKNRGK